MGFASPDELPFDGFRRNARDNRAPRSTVTAQLCGDPPANRPQPADAPITAALADLDEAAMLMLAALETLGEGSAGLPLAAERVGQSAALADLVAQIADRARSRIYLAHPHLKPKVRQRRARPHERAS